MHFFHLTHFIFESPSDGVVFPRRVQTLGAILNGASCSDKFNSKTSHYLQSGLGRALVRRRCFAKHRAAPLVLYVPQLDVNARFVIFIITKKRAPQLIPAYYSFHFLPYRALAVVTVFTNASHLLHVMDPCHPSNCLPFVCQPLLGQIESARVRLCVLSANNNIYWVHSARFPGSRAFRNFSRLRQRIETR